jgi:hypothetical protein
MEKKSDVEYLIAPDSWLAEELLAVFFEKWSKDLLPFRQCVSSLQLLDETLRSAGPFRDPIGRCVG